MLCLMSCNLLQEAGGGGGGGVKSWFPNPLGDKDRLRDVTKYLTPNQPQRSLGEEQKNSSDHKFKSDSLLLVQYVTQVNC